MAKDKEKESVPEKTERETRWDAFLEKYQKQNPAKYELKLAKGEFGKIPDSFK